MIKEEIWVYLERVKSGVSEISLQGLTLGRKLADESGMSLGGILLGTDLNPLVEELISMGSDVIHCAEDEKLDPFSVAPYKKVLTALCKGSAPRLLIFPASTQGNTIAATMASALEAGSVLDCESILYEGGRFHYRRVEFDGKVLSNYVILKQVPHIATIKDGIADPAKPKGHKGEVRDVEVVLTDEDLVSKVLERKIAPRSVNLKEAKIIVCAGAGVGSKENFWLIEEITEILQGEIGATRAAVDAGWVSADRQIGQTGVTVKPDLYIACGVSGAAQHRVGMFNSETIISINIDPNAPIFRFSHYGIVGDIAEVIPRLIQLIEGQG